MMHGLLHHMLRLLLACSIGLAILLSSFMLVQQISAPITSQHATIALVSADTPMNDPLAALDDLLVIGATGIGLASMRRWLLGKPTPGAWKAPLPSGYAASPGVVGIPLTDGTPIRMHFLPFWWGEPKWYLRHLQE